MHSTQVPGIKLVLKVFHCTPGSVESLAKQLRDGHILVIQLLLNIQFKVLMVLMAILIVCNYNEERMLLLSTVLINW